MAEERHEESLTKVILAKSNLKIHLEASYWVRMPINGLIKI